MNNKQISYNEKPLNNTIHKIGFDDSDDKSHYFYFPKISKLILNAAYSLILFSGAIYCLYAINNFFHTNENFLQYNNGSFALVDYFKFAVFDIISDNRIDEILALLINNFDKQTFCSIVGTTVFIFAVSFCAMFLITAFYNLINIANICRLKKFNKILHCPNPDNTVLRSYSKQNSLEKAIHINNVLYSSLTYLSIIITEVAVVCTSVIAGVALVSCYMRKDTDISSVLKYCKAIIIIGYIILLLIGIALIVKKVERITETPKGVYYENLGTYLIGILVALIPLLTIAAIAIFLLLCLLSFISRLAGGSRDEY